MYQTRKIGVVGQGHVGAHVANSLLMQGIADELYLCDINQAKVTSEVQDLRDSLSFVPYNTKIVNCYDHYEELACCDVIVNAAGKVALAAGNRDGELFFTTDAARTFAKRIVDAGFDGIFVSISNPCDVVCTELWHLTGYDPKKIIGSGCGLDSARLRTEISKKVGVSPKSIDAYMIGEHGFSQLAAFKAATIAGKSLNELQAENPDKYAFDHMEVEELARKGGYVTYQGKQCTEYAVANSAARVCAAVLHNEHAVLSASTLMTGQYGEEGIFTSLPCVIGAEGVEEVYTLDLSEHELEVVKDCFPSYLVLLDAHVATDLGAVVEHLAAGGAQLAAHVVEEDRLQVRTHAGRHVAHAVLECVEHHDRIGVRVEERQRALLHGAALARSELHKVEHAGLGSLERAVEVLAGVDVAAVLPLHLHERADGHGVGLAKVGAGS